MMNSVTNLSPAESARLLWGLTRPDRVTHLSRVAESHPHGALLTTPLGRMLITSTPTATKRVLVTHHANYQKGLGQSHARAIIGDGLLTAEGEHWKRQRQDVNVPLRAKAVGEHHDAIQALAQRNVHAFAADHSNSVPAVVRLTEYTLACLGETMGFAPPDASRIHEAFEVVQNEALFTSVSQGLVPLWARPHHQRRLRAALQDLASEAAVVIGQKRRTDRWATREGLTSLFLAGYETTASTLSWAIIHLAARPHLQERLRREATEFSRSTQVIGPADLARLKLTEAVFKETLRLRPPVWLLSREVVEPDCVDGVELRPGDEVLLLPSVVARRGWQDPDAFRPERFLDQSLGPSLWFGAGPRACPGGALANTEGVSWLAHACSSLEFRLHPGRRATPLARMSQTPAQELHHLVQIRARHTPARRAGQSRLHPVPST